MLFRSDPQLQEKLIKNPVNPDKVVRADSRAEYGNERGVRQEISYESNFGNFVQTLGSMSKVGDIMSKMLFSGMANLIEAGISQGTAEEIQTLLQLLEVNPDQLKVFLKNQMNGANKLKGSLFELLRGVMKEAGSVELKSGILEFLKKYNDMSSGKHIMENIKGELREIEEYMFRNDREQLRQLSMKLLPHKTGNTERNTQILKREIIPFLGKFIADTKNRSEERRVGKECGS